MGQKIGSKDGSVEKVGDFLSLDNEHGRHNTTTIAGLGDIHHMSTFFLTIPIRSPLRCAPVGVCLALFIVEKDPAVLTSSC